MRILCCDICRKQLPVANHADQFHFCERHAPYATEYIKEVQRIAIEGTTTIAKSMERYRNNLLQSMSVKSDLKVVENVR